MKTNDSPRIIPISHHIYLYFHKAQEHAGQLPLLYLGVAALNQSLDGGSLTESQSLIREVPEAIQLYKKEVSDVLSKHAIEDAKTEPALPIILDAMEDGTLPICVEYRNRNTVKIQYQRTTPFLDECMDSLGKETILFTLDASSRYWLVENVEGNLDKIAFTSHLYLFHLRPMPCNQKKGRLKI